MCESETMHLACDMSFAHTDHLWKENRSWRGYQYYGPDYYEEVARIAHRGMMDMVFFGDAAETPEIYGGNFDAAVKYGVRWPKHDMAVMAPLMARAAPNVGIGITMSTTYHHPFHVARLYASLDWVTGGRIAWNAVTSAYKNEAANWGFDEMMPTAQRYDRAREHMEVVRKLWDSVEPGAIVMDRENGVFGDPSKVHLINHRGKYFNVRGPLPTMPSPQKRPVVIQAGQSEDGMNLAAKFADMQFVSRKTPASIRAHRAQLDELLPKYGRSPRDLGVFWSVRTQVAETKEEAMEKDRRYMAQLPPNAGIIELSFQYGVDFAALKPDMKLVDAAEVVRKQQVHFGSFAELIKTEGETTVEEFGRRALTDRANNVVGNPKQVADHFEEMHEAGGKNGGIIVSKGFSSPGMIRDFVELVVPELRRRGLTRQKYVGSTLRENLNS